MIAKKIILPIVFIVISPIVILAWSLILLLGGKNSLGKVFVRTGCNLLDDQTTANEIRKFMQRIELKEFLKNL